MGWQILKLAAEIEYDVTGAWWRRKSRVTACLTVCYGSQQSQRSALLALCERNPLLASHSKWPAIRKAFLCHYFTTVLLLATEDSLVYLYNRNETTSYMGFVHSGMASFPVINPEWIPLPICFALKSALTYFHYSYSLTCVNLKYRCIWKYFSFCDLKWTKIKRYSSDPFYWQRFGKPALRLW